MLFVNRKSKNESKDWYKKEIYLKRNNQILINHKLNQFKMKTIGIAIMIIGLGMTIFTAITFFTREKVVDLGILEVTRNQPHYLNWSPFIGMAIMVVGGFLILQARKKQ